MLERLVESFRDYVQSGGSVDVALDEYLDATQSRAVGLWRLVGDELHVVGFRGHATMPPDVVEAFAAATRIVSLQQTGLGIVKAALAQQPAVALLTSRGGTLSGSAGWLERFSATQSLAVPLVHGSRTRGVLALSTAYSFGPEHTSWQLTEALAAQVAVLL